MRQIPQPIIAAVNGYAMGGGNELVIVYDLAIASERARFGQTGPRVGSSPVFGGTNMLGLIIGEKRAKEVGYLMAGSEEMTEGATAFLERRNPDFRRFRR